jgi:hypothetical protein
MFTPLGMLGEKTLVFIFPRNIFRALKNNSSLHQIVACLHLLQRYKTLSVLAQMANEVGLQNKRSKFAALIVRGCSLRALSLESSV